MRIDVDMMWVLAVLLCSLRLSALMLLTPFLQALGIPVHIRVLLILLLSTALVSSMHLGVNAMPHDVPTLITAGINEVLIGALMAFGIFVAFAAFSFAGNLLDLQMGFSIANILDPITRSQSPLIAALFGMAAVALFFTMEAHHALLSGVAYSLDRIPLGGAIAQPAPEALARQFGTVFTLGLLLAAPVLFCLFLVELCLAVLSRNLPQFNIFGLSAPIKIGIGLSLLATLSNQFGGVAKRIFGGVFTFWESAL
jgi:flagellar biosynthetic protein FliR